MPKGLPPSIKLFPYVVGNRPDLGGRSAACYNEIAANVRRLAHIYGYDVERFFVRGRAGYRQRLSLGIYKLHLLPEKKISAIISLF